MMTIGKGFVGWIVKTGCGSMIFEDNKGKLWHSSQSITVFKNRKKVDKVIIEAKKLSLSNGKAFSKRVYESTLNI